MPPINLAARAAPPPADSHRQTAMKILVLLGFILILGSLASAFLFLMKDKGTTNRTVTALAFRVGFSIAMFLLLLAAYKMGWIQPTGIRY